MNKSSFNIKELTCNLSLNLGIKASLVMQLSNVIVDKLVLTFQSIKESIKTLASIFFNMRMVRKQTKLKYDNNYINKIIAKANNNIY
jgi:hypothetical protein